MVGNIEKRKFVLKEDDVCIFDEDGNLINLKTAIGIISMRIYVDFVDAMNEKDAETKERLKNAIAFQSQVLDSLSKAAMAIRKS